MNPNQCRIALRPRDPLEVLDLSFRLVRECWRPLARTTVWTIGPLLALLVLGCWLTEGHYGLLAVPLAATPVIQAPYTVLLGRLLFADDAKVRDVFRDTLTRIGSLVGMWAAGTFALGVGAGVTCLLALPLVQMALLYVHETALLEQVGVQRGIRRSMRLAGGHSGIALVGAVAWWLLTLWFAIVGEAAGQGIVSFVLQLGTPLGSVITGQVTPFVLAGMMLAQPFYAVYRLLLYVDVRTRVEGWDLQVALRAAGMGK